MGRSVATAKRKMEELGGDEGKGWAGLVWFGRKTEEKERINHTAVPPLLRHSGGFPFCVVAS